MKKIMNLITDELVKAFEAAVMELAMMERQVKIREISQMDKEVNG